MDYSDFELSSLLGEKNQEIMEVLDEKAKEAIRTMLMMEYARCKTSLNGDAMQVITDTK